MASPRRSDDGGPREVPSLFETLKPTSRARLLGLAQVVEVARGQDLDTGDDALLVLLEGAVAMTVGEDGRRAVMAVLATPSPLNLDAVIAGEGGCVRWRALAPSRVLRVPADAFRAALRTDPGLAARALAELASAHRRLMDWARAQRLQSAQQRLVAYLLSLTPARTGEALVELPYEKNLLASLLGMTPENFSRALARLAPYGVQVRGPRVGLARLEVLRDLLDPADS